MTELTVRVSSKSIRTSSVPKVTTKNAWARYVRQRWPNNALKGAMFEWDLTEGQARGVLYAQASQTTIDQILDHPRGGFELGLLILEIKTAMKLEAFIARQAEGARLERARWESRERHWQNLSAGGLGLSGGDG